MAIVVSGSSAGGWLALLAGTGIGFEACGLGLPPKVAGIAAIYPITGECARPSEARNEI